jgi:plasmid stabilization system protein ParE
VTPLLIRPAAVADIEDVYRWYERQRVGLGDEFLAAIDAKLQDIAAQPAAYPVIHRQARRALVRRFPYAIFYCLLGETIVVVACMHGRRDPLRWQGRV